MKQRKRTRLPRGLHWDSRSPHIFFSWRDARGKQHQQSTQTADPEKALLFKLRYLEEGRDKDLDEAESDLRGLSLGQVAEMYFNWKTANNCPVTIGRERRMFKNVLSFFGPAKAVRSIHLQLIRKYQQTRRLQVSPTMKKPVSARTVNYEMHLLRGVLSYADCWTDNLEARYKPLRQVKSRIGKAATKSQLKALLAKARENEYWEVAMYSAALAVGTGCRSCEIKNLQLQDICLEGGKIVVRGEVAKNRRRREPHLMALGEWGLRQLLLRARALGATEPHHYLLPLHVSKSRHLRKTSDAKWDVAKPMTTWVKSWRKLMAACGMSGFRFHDLRHTFRTLGAEAGVPLEVMMAQLGHMDRETSLEYVHIQQRALERAKQLIESEQEELLAAVQGRSQAKGPESTGVEIGSGMSSHPLILVGDAPRPDH